jgi:hypothetical protein
MDDTNLESQRSSDKWNETFPCYREGGGPVIVRSEPAINRNGGSTVVYSRQNRYPVLHQGPADSVIMTALGRLRSLEPISHPPCQTDNPPFKDHMR